MNLSTGSISTNNQSNGFNPRKKVAQERILVVDDEEDILELMSYNLTKEGYQVECVMSGEDGLKSALRQKPDLLVLDLMLPGVDGLDVCRAIKSDARTAEIPIIMLTAKGEEADIVAGLELGADDYIVKPFSPRVLSARIRSVLRRHLGEPADSEAIESLLQLEDLVIDSRRHEVLLDERKFDLTLSEFKILQFLARNRGWVYTRYQIVDAVHGTDYPVTDRSVDVQIVGLRKKLGKHGHWIETVRGVGYRFKG